MPLLSAACAETQRLCCLLTGMTGDMGADQDTGAAAAAATVVTERACQTLLQSLSESLQLAHALPGRWEQGSSMMASVLQGYNHDDRERLQQHTVQGAYADACHADFGHSSIHDQLGWQTRSGYLTSLLFRHCAVPHNILEPCAGCMDLIGALKTTATCPASAFFSLSRI